MLAGQEHIVKRAPTGGSWKKGQSGNPSGLRRTDRMPELREQMRKYTRSAVATVLTIMRDKTVAPPVRLEAAKYIIDQGWGKPTQIHQNADGSPLSFIGVPDDELLAELERARAIEANAIDITPAVGRDLVPAEARERVEPTPGEGEPAP